MPLETFLIAAAFVFGCVWGSFFNVAIYRLPREMSLIRPGSHCFACNTPVAWYDNIPLISWLVLRGRCRVCGEPFSFRYFVVELISGLLFMFVMMKYVGAFFPREVVIDQGVVAATKPDVLGASLAVVLHWFFMGGFVVLTFIDFDHKIIPDGVSLPGIALGLIASAAVPTLVVRFPANPEATSHWQGLLQGAIGMAVGGGIMWFIAIAGRAVFKKEAMGGGDIKLMAMIGAFLGWQLVLLVLFFSALTGTVVGVTLIMMGRLRAARLIAPLERIAQEHVDKAMRKKAQREIEEIVEQQTGWSSQIPYGPYIVLGALIAFFFGPAIIDWYLGLFRTPEVLPPIQQISTLLL